MKQFSRIMILAAGVGAIVMFWLVPGINKADDTDYVRVYEDVDAKAVPVGDTTRAFIITMPPTASVKEKKWLREKIESEASIEDIDPEMFSRAIHYREEMLVEEFIAPEDSLVLHSADKVVKLDSTEVLADSDSIAVSMAQ